MSIDASKPPLLVRLRLDFVAALLYILVPGFGMRPDERHQTRSPWPIVPLGLGIGLLWVGTFRATWRVFGEVGNLRLIPSFAIVTVFALLTGRAMLLASMALLDSSHISDRKGDESQARVSQSSLIFMILVLLGLFVLVLSIQELRGWWPASGDWRSWFNWMYPRPIYRPLILAPLWGRWGMLVALYSGRTAGDADDLTRAYSRSLNVWKLVVHSALPLTLSCLYVTRGGRIFTGPMIAAILLALTILFSTIVANVRQGQSRTTILATGLFAQMMFIILYRAFWPLIER